MRKPKALLISVAVVAAALAVAVFGDLFASDGGSGPGPVAPAAGSPSAGRPAESARAAPGPGVAAATPGRSGAGRTAAAVAGDALETALVGRVVDQDGAPVPGVSVDLDGRIKSALADGSTEIVVTDAQGAFAYRFDAAGQVYGLAVGPTARTAAAFFRQNFRLGLGETRSVTLEVDAGLRIRGLVKDADGATVSGARVMAWRVGAHRIDGAWSKPAERVAVTDEQGAFELVGVSKDFYLAAEAEGLRSSVRLRGEVDDRTELDGLELVVAPAGILRGRLLDAAGQPIAAHRVGNHFGSQRSSADDTDVPGVIRRRPEHNVTTTGADGSFQIEVVASHRYLWEVQHPEHPMWRQRHGLADGELEIRLERGVELSGRVFDASGAPVAGADVALNDYPTRRTQTDATGRFRLRGAQPLEERSFLTVAHDDSAVCCVQPIPGGGQDVQVRLERPQSIAGVVVDERGRPVVDALVTVVGDRRVQPGYGFGGVPTWEWAHDLEEGRTDAEGAFRFERLYAGIFELRVTDPTDSDLVHRHECPAGSEGVVVQFDRVAMRGVVFKGEVFDALDGTPLDEFTVTPMQPNGQGGARGTPREFEGAAGTFELVGKEAGDYYLNVQAPGYAEWRSDQRSYDIGEHRVRVDLMPVRTLELVVEDDEGSPAFGSVQVFDGATGEQRMIATSSNSTSSSVSIGNGGRAALGGLPAGLVTLKLTLRGALPLSQDVDLRVPRSEPLVIRVPAGPPAVRMAVMLMGYRDGADRSAFEGEPGPEWLEAAAQNPNVWFLEADATGRLTTADGNPVSFVRCKKLPEVQEAGPGMRFHVYQMVEQSSDGGSSTMKQPSPGAVLTMNGIRTAMRLVVQSPGYERVERDIDPAELDGETAILVVWMKKT